MARESRDDPQWQQKALRLLRLKRAAQLVTMGLILVFIALSFVMPPEFGRILLPLVLLSLAAFSVSSGFVAYELGYSGIGFLDGHPGRARWAGILWMFAGFFLAIFALSYFFT